MNFKQTLAALFFALILSIGNGFAQTESLLQELSYAIENQEKYAREKNGQIDKLQKMLSVKDLSLDERFTIYSNLHSQYKTYQYDSAFTYARKLQEIAGVLGDPAKKTWSKLKLCHTLLSSGMFYEALDSLNTIKPGPFADSIKVEFYALKARACYDLSRYNNDIYYSSRYIKEGERYLDSALVLLDENNMRFYELRGMKRENSPENEKAEAESDFQIIIEKFNPTLNEYAMAANSLGSIYYQKGEVDKAIEMMVKAATADLKASVKEGVALMTLSEFLYQTGDETRAYDYIKQALKDADFYGAKQRKIMVAAILPVIEGERLATVENQKSRLIVYAVFVSILSVLVVIFAFIIFRQLKQLRLTKRTVTEANQNLREVNDKLKETNEMLQEANGKLLEVNRIKEEYIGYSFNMYTEYLDKLEKLKISVEKKLRQKKFDDVSQVLESVNMKKEREALFLSFDKVFLKLFPDFVSEFNAFFRDEDKFILKDQQSLQIDLRIFALIRLGIQDHEQIARILEYSVRTIYNYKTKVKNKSILSNEEFEEKVMGIKAF